MDKTDIRIPTDEELTAYMEKSAVSANGAYEQSPVVLMVDDAAIGTLGNFSASIGKASIVGPEAVGAIPYTGQIRKLLTLQPLQRQH